MHYHGSVKYNAQQRTCAEREDALNTTIMLQQLLIHDIVKNTTDVASMTLSTLRNLTDETQHTLALHQSNINSLNSSIGSLNASSELALQLLNTTLQHQQSSITQLNTTLISQNQSVQALN